MAEMSLAALRWVASRVVNKLLANASTYLDVDLTQELQDLEITFLLQFDLIIEAAEKSPHKGKLKAWLKRHKEAFYDTDDLLDEHEYNLLKRQAKSGKDLSPGEDDSFKSTILKPLRAVKNKASNLLPENRRIIRKLNELKVILAEVKEFRASLGIPAVQTTEGTTIPTETVPPSTSLPPPEVFGRDIDRDLIIDLLTKESAADGCSTRYSGVAIVGHAGAGKSTLAQHIYNDDRIKEHFDVRMWVCISREIDVHRHTQGILESALNWKCPHFDNLDTLQKTLKGILEKSKKFLLVLDDVWFKESSKEKEWDLLLRPLVSQQAGSKVLVTSVRDVLPAALFCNEVIRLEDMDDADFLALFKHHAFSGAEIRDQWLQLQLEEIAEKIAKRLGRSPLAAKVIGSQLSMRKVINAWKDALMINNLSEPMRALLWSYEKLDPNLQRCFLYCSLFPKGYSYDINELVHLWVAEGLVVSYNHNKSMEDIGWGYFNELVSGSFFQQLVSGRFVMHDLLHDLTELLSTEDCFRLEDDKVTQIPHTVRHLSVRVESMIKHKEIICKLNHLRTVICIEPLMDDACVLFDEILQNLKKLRVLYLSFHSSSKLPESIGDLKHLRYLNMVKTSISELPTSICNLYHLQLLQLNHRVKHLPEKFCELSNLRHLHVYDGRIDETSERALPLFPNISKLTSLQQLHEFSVQKKKGYDLEQLRDMNELGGSLRVTNLENVTGKHEALDSNLQKKNRLRKLHLAWSSQNHMSADDSLHLDVLEGFIPPSQLNILTIEGYNSASYPSWLLDASYLESLNSFALINCSMLQGLPPDSRIFLHCYELLLHNVPNLKTLSVVPPGLASLSISRCPMLMFITHDELEQHNSGENVIDKDHLESHLALLWEVDSRSYMYKALCEEYFSLVELMTLMDEDISNHLLMIKQVVVEGDKLLAKQNVIKAWLYCHQQRIRIIYGAGIASLLTPPSGLCRLNLSTCSITDGALSTCLSGLTSLRFLSLEHIMNLTALPSEDIFQGLRNLGLLDISYWWCLRSLGGLRAATSLTKVSLLHCPSLNLARGAEFMPVSVEDLEIFSCVLTADFFCTALPNLEILDLSSCRSSAFLPVGHLTSLQALSLLNMPDLCMLEDLSSLQLHHVHLIDVPKLSTECISEYRVQKSLHVSSSVMLNNLLATEGFLLPASISLQSCTETSSSFNESVKFSSVKSLAFHRCLMKSLPINVKYFLSLETLVIEECHGISSLPDLPPSLQYLCVKNCTLLKESCRAPDGESWPKIAFIRWKDIQ